MIFFAVFMNEKNLKLPHIFFKKICRLKRKSEVRGVIEEKFKFFLQCIFKKGSKNFFFVFRSKNIGAKSWIEAFFGGKGPAFLPPIHQSSSYSLKYCQIGWNYLQYTRINQAIVFFFYSKIFLLFAINKSPNIGQCDMRYVDMQ